MFLDCNSQKPSPPAVPGGFSGSSSPRSPGWPKVGNQRYKEWLLSCTGLFTCRGHKNYGDAQDFYNSQIEQHSACSGFAGNSIKLDWIWLFPMREFNYILYIHRCLKQKISTASLVTEKLLDRKIWSREKSLTLSPNVTFQL